MAPNLRRESLDSDGVSRYLRQRISRSVVYTLSLQQPLNLKELQTHPVRRHFLELLTGKETRSANLRRVVKRGADLGVLLPSTARREYYYFLNSDLRVRPPALTEDDGHAEIGWEPTAGTAHQEIVVPATKALGTGHPIPRFRDPSTCLAWFDWLSDSRGRAVLQWIQEHGPATRRDLVAETDGLSLAAARAGLRCGVLRLRGERWDFPFARMRLPEGDIWTAKPPRFWLTPSYEPLRCLQGWEAYASSPQETSPAQALREMEADGRKVLPRRRKRHLSLNLLYEASATIPAVEEVGPATLPSVWENRRGWVYPVKGGYERAEASLALKEELDLDAPSAGQDMAPEALARLAEKRVEAYLARREQELSHRYHEVRGGGFGLGADAILSLASEELERGRLLEERKYFEAFLEVLRG